MSIFNFILIENFSSQTNEHLPRSVRQGKTDSDDENSEDEENEKEKEKKKPG